MSPKMRKYAGPAVGCLVAVIIIYFCCVGLFSRVAGQNYTDIGVNPVDDHAKAVIISEGLVRPLEEELTTGFGWLPNDILTPRIIDNKTNYQRGIIYATRSASDILEHRVARFGETDTLPPMLDDATARQFTYGEDVWGWYSVYNAEKHYFAGIADWRKWASLVGLPKDKKGQVFNMTTSDVVEIMRWASAMMEYCLGVLNDENIGHFRTDDVVYYVKGVTRVVQGVLESVIAVDSSVVDRGGKENIDACLARMRMVAQFNPVYVVGGTYGIGDNFWPNHIAALARHIDILGNRLTDARKAMER